MPRHKSIPLLITALLLPALAIAQWQVNRQIASPGAAQSVRFAGSIQNQSATYMTPSQSRMAVHASGATPSELKTSYNRIGPMAPSGAIAYIPPPPTYRTTYSGTQGNYVNTQVAPGGRSAPVNSFPVTPQQQPSAGSVRYSGVSTPAINNSVTAPVPSAWSFLGPSNGAPVGQTYGSVRYSP